MASGTMDRHLTYVAMTRHRDQVKLYAARDELKDIKALSASMSRSGVKETTLDYTQDFADRRGLALKGGVRSEIAIRSGELQARTSDASDRVEPLVPAVTGYSRSIAEVAREKARPDLTQAMETVRAVAGNVYVDPDGVVSRLSAAIIDEGVDAQSLAKSLGRQPEQFGELLGKTGLLGESRDRKAARHHAKALGNHVASAARTWERRFEAEQQSEAWARDRRDVVEVPGLTARSEAILQDLDRMAYANKPQFLEQLAGTPEGKQALDEAGTIVGALKQRFGTADLLNIKPEDLRLGPEVTARLDRIKDVARIVDRAERHELTRQYEIKRSLSKGLGLGM
jgi:ATP-dependent exoDNAse (exonuclease V) beta subunit